MHDESPIPGKDASRGHAIATMQGSLHHAPLAGYAQPLPAAATA